jgi:hypothetical protein
MRLHDPFILVVVTRTYALCKPARARSLRAASARDTFVLGNEINRAAFYSAFMTPEGLSGGIDVKRASCVLKPDLVRQAVNIFAGRCGRLP